VRAWAAATSRSAGGRERWMAWAGGTRRRNALRAARVPAVRPVHRGRGQPPGGRALPCLPGRQPDERDECPAVELWCADAGVDGVAAVGGDVVGAVARGVGGAVGGGLAGDGVVSAECVRGGDAGWGVDRGVGLFAVIVLGWADRAWFGDRECVFQRFLDGQDGGVVGAVVVERFGSGAGAGGEVAGSPGLCGEFGVLLGGIERVEVVGRARPGVRWVAGRWCRRAVRVGCR
jgi:hypothetical protein